MVVPAVVLLAGVQLRAAVRPGHRLPGLRPAGRGLAQRLGRIRPVPPAVRRPAVLGGAEEHAVPQLRPAGPVLPDPDRAGPVAQLGASASGCATSSSPSSTCRTSSPGCLRSRSSSRCSAARARSTSSCAARPRHLGHHDQPAHLRAAGHLAGDLEGGGLGDHRLPGRPRRHQQRPVRGGGRGRRRAGSGGCGTSPCPGCAG